MCIYYGGSRLKTISFISALFLKYQTKISFHQKMTHWVILPSNVFNVLKSREGVFKTLENWKILNLWVVINKKLAIFGISSPAHTFNPDSLPDLALNASFK